MNRAQFSQLLDRIQELEFDAAAAGQKEYAHDEGNCFANFDSDDEIGLTRLQSISAFANKHWRGIRAYVKGYRSQREDVRGRIKDLRLFLALMWAAIDEEEYNNRLTDASGKGELDEFTSLSDDPRVDLSTAPRFSDLVLPPNTDDPTLQNECNEAAETARLENSYEHFDQCSNPACSCWHM